MRHILENRPSIHLFVLTSLCLAVFANTLVNDFVWEDVGLVAQNYYIRDHRNIPLFFTADHWKSRPAAPDTGFRPLRETSFAIDYLLWGLNPRGYHLTNLLLHLTNVVLVYSLVLMLMAAASTDSREEITGQSGFLSPAFLTALFFALHPIHTESVSYIKNRSDLLAFIFFQSACLLFIFRHSLRTTRERLFYYMGALVCFLLSLWSKPMALTLPLVLSLYVVCFSRERPLSKSLLGLWPFFGLALVYFWFQQSFMTAAEPGKTGFDSGSWSHIWTVVTTLGWYLKMLVWPAPLNIYHMFYPPASLSDLPVLLSLAALLAILALLRATAAGDRLFFFGLGWILITLVPVANFFVLYERPMAEQRLYIPSFGFCLVLAMVIRRVSAIKPAGFKKASTSLFPYVMTVIICALYSFLTVQRNFEWRDPVSLFSSTVVHSPNLDWTHNRLGSALKEKGRLDEALDHYNRAVALNPGHADYYNNVGAILGEKGEFNEAINCFETALRLEPGFTKARNNLGLAWRRQGHLDRAISEHRMALALEPGNALSYLYLAVALEAAGRLDEAIGHYQTALDLNPYDAQAHSRLGAVLLKKNDPAGACRHFVRASEIDPKGFALPVGCR